MRAGWGRYTQADPLGLGGGANLYRYTSNPNRDIDPLGLIRIRREEMYDRNPAYGGFLTDHGSTDPHLSVRANCEPEGNCWKLEFDVFLRYTIHYASSAEGTKKVILPSLNATFARYCRV